MFFDAECPICGRVPANLRLADHGVCAPCATSLDAPPALPSPTGLDACRCLTGYRQTGRLLVTRLKFHNHRAVIPFAAAHLADRLVDDHIDVVTWAPTAPKRRRQRGFDQAELLADAIARELHVPVRRCLARLPGPAQTGRHRDERILGPHFDAGRGLGAMVAARRVGLVDDVVTTGATLSRAAEVLRANGAAAVIGVVVARTPRPGTTAAIDGGRQVTSRH